MPNLALIGRAGVHKVQNLVKIVFFLHFIFLTHMITFGRDDHNMHYAKFPWMVMSKGGNKIKKLPVLQQLSDAYSF